MGTNTTENVQTAAQIGQEKLLTIRNVAEALNFSPRQICRWIAGGQIAVLHFGRKVRIHPDEIARIKSCGLPGATETILGKTDCAVSSRVSRRKERRRLWEST